MGASFSLTVLAKRTVLEKLALVQMVLRIQVAHVLMVSIMRICRLFENNMFVCANSNFSRSGLGK